MTIKTWCWECFRRRGGGGKFACSRMLDSKRKKRIGVIVSVVVEHRTKKATGRSLRHGNFFPSLRIGPSICSFSCPHAHISFHVCRTSTRLSSEKEKEMYALIVHLSFLEKGTREG